MEQQSLLLLGNCHRRSKMPQRGRKSLQCRDLRVEAPQAGDANEHPWVRWRRDTGWSRGRLAAALGIGTWMLRGLEFGNGEADDLLLQRFEEVKASLTNGSD